MLGVDEFIADTIEDLKGKIPGKAIIACSGVLPYCIWSSGLLY